MTIRGSTLKNREVRLQVMTIRHSTLLVSWYEGLYFKVSVNVAHSQRCDIIGGKKRNLVFGILRIITMPFSHNFFALKMVENSQKYAAVALYKKYQDTVKTEDELLKREIDYADEITYNAKIIVQKYKCFKNAWYVDFIGLVGIAVLILAA